MAVDKTRCLVSDLRVLNTLKSFGDVLISKLMINHFSLAYKSYFQRQFLCLNLRSQTQIWTKLKARS